MLPVSFPELRTLFGSTSGAGDADADGWISNLGIAVEMAGGLLLPFLCPTRTFLVTVERVCIFFRLRDNGRDPMTVKGVEFTDVGAFEKEMNRMPNFTLHELAHAYHTCVLARGFDNAEI